METNMRLDVKNLRNQMECQNISMTELSQSIGISRQALYNIMNGKSQPRPDTLNRICDRLGCLMTDLLAHDAECILADPNNESTIDVAVRVIDLMIKQDEIIAVLLDEVFGHQTDDDQSERPTQ